MLYAVGSRIDLRHLNPPAPADKKPVLIRMHTDHKTFISGTKISFLKMARGLVVMSIVEPPIALQVSVGA